MSVLKTPPNSERRDGPRLGGRGSGDLGGGLMEKAFLLGSLPAIAVGALDAARLLGIGRTLFLQLHSSGNVPRPIELGARRVWSVDELREWVAAGCPSREQWTAMRQGALIRRA